MSTGQSCDGINFSNNPVQADYEQVFSKNRQFKNCFFLFRDRVTYVSAITSETNCTDMMQYSQNIPFSAPNLSVT